MASEEGGCVAAMAFDPTALASRPVEEGADELLGHAAPAPRGRDEGVGYRGRALVGVVGEKRLAIYLSDDEAAFSRMVGRGHGRERIQSRSFRHSTGVISLDADGGRLRQAKRQDLGGTVGVVPKGRGTVGRQGKD